MELAEALDKVDHSFRLQVKVERQKDLIFQRFDVLQRELSWLNLINQEGHVLKIGC